jgi:outer membrane protein
MKAGEKGKISWSNLPFSSSSSLFFKKSCNSSLAIASNSLGSSSQAYELRWPVKKQNFIMMPRLFFLSLFFLTSSLLLNAQSLEVWDLDRCVTYALDHNIQVQQTALQVEGSEYALKQSKLNRLPNLNANVNFSDNIGYVVDPFTNEFDNTNIRSGNLSFSSDFNIFRGFETSNRIKRNQVNLAANQQDYAQARNDITLQVTQAYLNILFNQELVANSEAQLESIRERRDQTQKLVKAGTQALAALLDLESQLATEELNNVNARNQLALAYLSLQQLLTLDPNDDFEIEKPQSLAAEGYDLSGDRAREIYQAALGNQPNVRAAELRITAAEYDMEIAKAGRLPSLGLRLSAFTGYSSARRQLTGDFRTQKDTVGVEFQGMTENLVFSNQVPVSDTYPFLNQLWDQRNFSIGAGLSVPIFSRGFNINQIQQAEIQVRNNRYSSQLIKQRLKQTIQQAYLDVRSSLATYEATQKQLEALETTFQNSEKQFNLGVINSVDYLLAKNNLIRAQNDLLRTKYDYIFKTKILDFYEGKPITID